MVYKNILTGKSACTIGDIVGLSEETRSRMWEILGLPATDGLRDSYLWKISRLLSGESISELWFTPDTIVEPSEIFAQCPEATVVSQSELLAPIFVEIYMNKDLKEMNIDSALESVFYYINNFKDIPPISIFDQMTKRIWKMRSSKRQKMTAPQFWINWFQEINLSQYYYRFDRWYNENKTKIDSKYGESVTVFYGFMDILRDTFNPSN